MEAKSKRYDVWVHEFHERLVSFDAPACRTQQDLSGASEHPRAYQVAACIGIRPSRATKKSPTGFVRAWLSKVRPKSPTPVAAKPMAA